MRNTVRTILLAFAIILFIVSTIFNILFFRSAYASLMFSKNDILYRSMYTSASMKLGIDNKNSGVQIEATNTATCNKLELQYHVDNEGNLTIKQVCTFSVENGKEKTTYDYFKDGVLYTDDGEQKTKRDVSTEEITSVLSLFLPSIDYNEEGKTGIAIGLPYVMGIKYSFKDSVSKQTYKYDLKGRIRSIVKKEGDKETTYKINYKNKTIDFPDFTQFA